MSIQPMLQLGMVWYGEQLAQGN